MSDTVQLNVELGARSYPIYIGAGILSDNELIARFIHGRKVMLISNETVAPLYLDQAMQSLGNFEVDTLVLPDGEQYKTLETLNRVYTRLLQRRFDRNTGIEPVRWPRHPGSRG